MSIVSLGSADRSGGTRDERHHREPDFFGCFGLLINAALVTVIAKDPGRQLATRIAIDAGGIYKETPGNFPGKTLFRAGKKKKKKNTSHKKAQKSQKMKSLRAV